MKRFWFRTPSSKENKKAKTIEIAVRYKLLLYTFCVLLGIYYMTSSVSGQDEPNRALWLATRAGKMERYCPLGISRLVPQDQRSFFGVLSHIINPLLTKILVKMTGYWPRSFFACLWTSTSSRSINTQKKNLANIQSSWPHAWSITHTYKRKWLFNAVQPFVKHRLS